MMRLFSSRRESITADLRARAARFEQRYGRAPSQRELAHLAQASNFKTRKPKDGALDVAQVHAGWADKLARTLGVRLASVAPSVWHAATGRAAAHARGADGAVPDRAGAGPRGAEGGRAGPAGKERLDPRGCDQVPGPGPAPHRQGPGRGRRAAGGSGRPGAALGVRAGGLPGGTRAGRGPGQLAARGRAQRLPAARRHPVRDARAAGHGRADGRAGPRSGAPRLTRAQAARALGADLAQLEAALAGRARRHARTRARESGLRADQAAAALSVLTDGQRVSVINAPAGAGKTRVLAETGRAWAAAGLGPVIGITASQSARNTLAAGVPVSYNAAQFLGHLPGRRGARGPVETGPRPLLLVDEASMMPGPDLADLIAYAEARDGKVILAGDTSQLQAVENGGGMSLLADALGYVRLAEPVRFRTGGNSTPACGCATGTLTVLADYDQHGRITGGDPEQMMDAAAAAYVALTADGTECC